MITIPFYSMLIVYGAFLLFFLILFFVNFRHLIKSGMLTIGSFFVTLLFTGAILIIFFFTYSMLININWSDPITIWDNSWFSSFFTGGLTI